MSQDEDTLAFCPECHKPMPADSVKCPHCGAVLPLETGGGD